MCAVNAVLGNLLGVVLTPYLLLRLVGSAGSLSALDTLRKLATRVVLPLLAGQLLRTPLQRARVLAGRKKVCCPPRGAAASASWSPARTYHHRRGRR